MKVVTHPLICTIVSPWEKYLRGELTGAEVKSYILEEEIKAVTFNHIIFHDPDLERLFKDNFRYVVIDHVNFYSHHLIIDVIR